MARAFSRAVAHLYPPVCTHCAGMGFIYWFRSDRLWNSLNAAHEGHADIQKTGNLRAVQLLLGHTKMESTVRYLGVELEDALVIAEAIEI